MAKRDYYEVLGVSKSASDDEIKRAYRKLAIQYHPDRNQGNKESEDKFREATEAYEILFNTEKRKIYDQYGHAGINSAGGASHDPNAFRGFEDLFSGGFGDFFGSFFTGGGSSRTGTSSRGHGSDLNYNLVITLEESHKGHKVTFNVSNLIKCSTCKGTGSKDSSSRKTCSTCRGTGQIQKSAGFFAVSSTCHVCRGEGYVIERPCATCSGRGLIKKSQELTVTIPRGLDSGQSLRLEGRGNASASSGPNGDLYIHVKVKEHRYFDRHHDDLYCVIPIGVTTTILGGEVFIKTLDGEKVKLKIPAGIQEGESLRLKGKGVSVLNSGGRCGDMYVKIKILIPKKINAHVRQLVEQLDVELGSNSEPIPLSRDNVR